MKKYLGLIIFLSGFLASAVEISKTSVIFNGNFNWRGNYKLELTRPVGWTDPGDYTDLIISKNKKNLYQTKSLQAVKVDNNNKLPAGSILVSPYLYLIPISSIKDDKVLIFSNWMGGSSVDQLVFLALDTNGIPYEIFKESYTISSVKDYNRDKFFDILTLGGRGEASGNNDFSYDPFLVFKQVRKKDKITFKIDEALSKKWSLENHFTWHGIKYDEKLRVQKNGDLVKN